MKILGIHTDFHDTGAAVFVNGKPIAAVNEERYSRKKMDSAFPTLSIAEVLRLSGLKEKDFDAVAFSGSKPGLKKMYRFFRDQNNRIFFTKGKYILPNLSPSSFDFGRLFRQIGIASAVDAFRIGRNVKRFIGDFQSKGFTGEVLFFEHDYCHAASAYWSAGFENALVCVIEGSSFINSASFWEGKGGNLRKVHEIPLPYSLGRYYELVTLLLGFNPKKHAGKITGLAAFGDASKLYDIVSKLLFFDGTSVRMSPDVFVLYEQYRKTKKPPKSFEGHKKEDIAAAFQKRMEDVITELITHLLKRYPTDTVVLSGGVASNVKLNMEIMHIQGIRHVAVHPGMTDAGQAFGAGIAAQKLKDKKFKPFRLAHVYLGTVFGRDAIRTALEKAGVLYEKPENYAARVAELLAKKKTVALFHGAMEYGPRALGNRSILYSAEDRSVNDWLNKQLKRTEFMPFAPVTLAERAYDCYDRTDIERAGDSVKFMTMAVRVTPFMKERMSAAVHVDGTARPQLIDRKTNEMYWSILKEYEKRTGLPTLVNTSFNMHEEPIICTPEEAIIAYEQSHLDVLAMPPYLIVRKNNTPG
jgi:carbamoyltransferase